MLSDGVGGCGRSRGTRRSHWPARPGSARSAGRGVRLASSSRTTRSVGVRGPSIQGNPTDAVEVVANGPQGWITVTIGATGMVQFGNAELVDGSCQAENEVPVPDG